MRRLTIFRLQTATLALTLIFVLWALPQLPLLVGENAGIFLIALFPILGSWIGLQGCRAWGMV